MWGQARVLWLQKPNSVFGPYMENTPEVQRHIPCPCSPEPLATSAGPYGQLLKYLLEGRKASRGSLARTRATRARCSHPAAQPQPPRVCGWGAGKGQPGSVPCVSLWLGPAACLEWMWQGQGFLSSWPQEPHSKVFIRQRATKCTESQRDTATGSSGDSLWVGDDSSSPEVVFCERAEAEQAAGCWGTPATAAESRSWRLLLTPGDSCHSAAPVTAQPGCWPRGRALAWEPRKSCFWAGAVTLEQRGLCCSKGTEIVVVVKGGRWLTNSRDSSPAKQPSFLQLCSPQSNINTTDTNVRGADCVSPPWKVTSQAGSALSPAVCGVCKVHVNPHKLQRSQGQWTNFKQL